MNTAIYLRKSRADELNPEDTLDKHKETLLEFAAKNNLTVTHIYEEIVSGESIFARPQMLQLLKDLEENKYEAVLCMDIDRLGRGDMEEQGFIMNKFRYSNTKIITPREVYQPGDEKDEMFFEFKGIIARNELKAIKRRMGEGRKNTVAKGGYIAEPPYGYKRAWKNKLPTLEPIPEQAEIVKMIFNMYIDGAGSQLIADHLNQLGIKSRKGDSFSRNTIRFILQNKTYIGLIQWNRNKHIRKKSPDDKHRRKIMPESEWIIVPGLHPPIIDEDVFYQAEEIRKTRSHPPSNTGEVKNPFSGILYCKNCGRMIVRQMNKKDNKARLLCAEKNCNKSILLEDVEAMVYQSINDFLEQCKYESATKKDNTKPIRATLERLNQQLKKATAQKNKLHDFLEQGIYDIPTFMERKNTLETEITAIQNSIEIKQAELHQSLARVNQNFIPDAEKLLRTYWSCSEKEKNILLKSIIRRMEYSREKGEWNNGFSVDIDFKFK